MAEHYKIIRSKGIENNDPSLENIRLDSLKLTNGDTMDRLVVRRKDGVKILPITPDNQVILIKEHRYACGKDVVMMPGGAIDKGETPEQAAKRELFEETGYKAEIIKHLFTVESCSALVDENRHFYLALGLYQPNEESNKDAWEKITLAPMSLECAIERAKSADFAHPETNLTILLAVEGLKNWQ